MKNLSLYWTFIDSWVMFQRNTKHMFRNPEALMISVMLPIILMLMFVYVFGGAIQTEAAYVNFIVPGIIITCIGYASSMTAMSVCQDMVGGLYERLRSMPVHPAALLVGHVAGSFVRNSISAILVFIIALLIGFQPQAGLLEWLFVIALLSLYLLAISWLSVIFGLLAKNVETASAFTFFIMFLPYVSSAFVPTETMPSWLHAFADNQPMTPLIDTLRGLLLGTPIGNSGWLAVSWFGGLLIVSVFTAIYIFGRKGKQ